MAGLRLLASMLLLAVSAVWILAPRLAAGQGTTTGDQGRITAMGERFRVQMNHYFGNSPNSELVFVLDSSSRVGPVNYNRAVDFIRLASTLISVSANTTRVAVVSFSNCWPSYIRTYIDYISSPHGKNGCTLMRDLSSVVYHEGGRCTAAGLRRGGEVLARGDSQALKVLMLLTNGASSYGGTPQHVAADLASSGIVLFTIGLGDGISHEVVNRSVPIVSEHFFLLENLGDVSTCGSIPPEAQDTMTSNQGPITATGERFRDQMNHYFGNSSNSELVFVLDSSGSIGPVNYNRAVDFIRMTSTLISVSASTTRVAVVSYSNCEPSDIRTYIDYISSPLGKNQCTFAQDVSGVSYHGGSTCTAGGLRKAGEVLASGDSQALKVLMLLTDGPFNEGGSPQPIAAELKSSGVVVFSIGLGGAIDFNELNGIATSVSYHVFLLKNLGDVSSLGPTLTEDINDSFYEEVNEDVCNGLCNAGTNCCHDRAICACATRSGSIVCACEPGFSGSGTDCQVCPVGTYKANYGEETCNLCPSHSSTLMNRSSSRTDCVCDVGYEGNPGDVGGSCQPVPCPALSVPAASGVLMVSSNCDNHYLGICEFQCREKYRPTGGEDHVTCLATGAWSGTPLQCTKITCAALSAPNAGNVYPADACTSGRPTFGQVCVFVCKAGYRAEGATTQTTCQEDGTWSLPAPNIVCVVITCAALSATSPVKIDPADACTSGQPAIGQVCEFVCKAGYRAEGATTQTTCQEDGAWSLPASNIVCVDIESPEITCPSDVTDATDPRRPTKIVRWTEPVPTDNSGVELAVESQYSSPHSFHIGQTVVTYSTTDAVGLTANCSFIVTIIDEEPPMVSNCSADIYQQASLITGLRAISWNDPNFIDNSGIPVQVDEPQQKPGSIFPLGEYNLAYRGTDQSGNENECNFTVSVANYACPYYPPPVNGVVACDVWAGGQYCAVSCDKNYNFTRQPETLYYCAVDADDNAVWSRHPSASDAHVPLQMPWPDCTAPVPAGGASTNVLFKLFANCASGRSQKKIRDNFIILLENFQDSLDLCQVSECVAKNVVVECGKTTTTTGRRRRRQLDSGGGVGVVDVTFTLSVVSAPADVDFSTATERTVGDGNAVASLNGFVASLQDAVVAGNVSIVVNGEELRPVPDSLVVSPNLP